MTISPLVCQPLTDHLQIKTVMAGPGVYPAMAFDLSLSKIKRSFGRSEVSAEWLLISYMGGTPQSPPFRRHKQETNFVAKQVEWNGTNSCEMERKWNETEWSEME